MNHLKALLITLTLACAFSPPVPAQTSIVQATGIGTSGTDCSTAIACTILQFTPGSLGSASIWITGTWSGTLQFEVTSDVVPSNATNAQLNALTWVSVNAFPVTSTTGVSNTTGNGLWTLNAANITALRVRASAFASGLATVTIRASTASASKGGGGGSGGGVTIYTVATLPAGLGAGGTGTLATVKDGTSASDCTVGGSTFAVTCIWTGSAWAFAGSSAGAPAFSAITAGTNTNALVVGTAGTLTTASTGTINANLVNGGTVPASAPLVGTNVSKQPISVTTIPTSTVPAFTGDMTNPAGSLATTVGAINGGSVPATAKILGSNGSSQPIAAALGPTHIYVGSAGSLPVDVALSGDSSITSAGVMTNTAVNGGTFPATAKVIGTNGSSQPIATALFSGHLFVGNGSNLPADVTLSGDSSITTLGVMTNTGLNGGAVPISASVLGTNGSAQPVAATAHAIGVPSVCSGSGTGTAQTCSTSPTFTAGPADCISFTPSITNTGDVTLAVNGGTAFHVYKWGGSSTLAAGDMVGGVTLPICLDANNLWELPTVGNPPASGATINNQNQYGAPYYSIVGSNNTLSGVAPPTTQGYFNYDWLNTTNASTTPQVVQVGLTGRALTGAATTCGAAVLYSDVNSWIDHDQAASGTVNCSLPTPTTLNNTAFAFRYTNHSAQTDTITPAGGFTIQSGTSAAASTLTVATGVGCGIIVDPNAPTTNWLADCANITGNTGAGTVTHSVGSLAPAFAPVVANGGADIQSEGGGELSIVLAGASTEVCGPINTALLAAQTAGVVQPIISLRGIPINLTCNQDPFAGFTGTNGFTLDIGGGQITTDVPWAIPFHGKIIGTNGRGAFITASSTFRTNYPAIVGNSTTDTVCLSNGSATVTAGTNVSGTCTAGGTATFTPPYNAAALASPPTALGFGSGCTSSGAGWTGFCYGYYLFISPSGVAPTAASTLSVGRVVAVSGSTLTLAGVINGNVKIPANGTGYQFALVMPVVSLDMRNSIDPTYGDQTQFDGIGIGAGDPTTSSHGLNCHVLFMNNYYQENSWLRNSFLTNACWAYVVVHGNAANSGPYSNIYALSSTDYSGYNATTGSVGISIRQVGTIHGFSDSTFNLRAGGTLTANPILLVTNYRVAAGGFGVPNYGGIKFSSMHLEPGVGGDSVLIGDTEAWPWVTGGVGEGAQGATFVNVTGTPLNTTGNLFHISNATSAWANQNIVIEGSGTEQTLNCIQDDVNSVTYQNCPPRYDGPATAAPLINAGAETIGGQLKVTEPTGSIWGSATGGAKGAGTINAAGLYINGTSVGTGGTVTVVGSGNLTSTAIVTGGGTQLIQTPSATATLSSGGAPSFPGAGTFSVAGAASTPGLLVSGAPFTGGSTSTTQPQLYISSGGSVTGFSTAGTLFGMNAPSGFTGNLIDSFLNGGATHLFTVNNAGNGTFAGTLTCSAATCLGSDTATTQSSGDNSTKVATTAFTNTEYMLVQTSGSPFTLLGLSGYYYNDTAAGYTFQLDAPVAGKQYCFGNRKARAQIITIKSLASVTIYYKGVAGTTGTGGSLVSGGAAGDFVCMVGTDTTTYEATGAGFGTWTNN